MNLRDQLSVEDGDGRGNWSSAPTIGAQQGAPRAAASARVRVETARDKVTKARCGSVTARPCRGGGGGVAD